MHRSCGASRVILMLVVVAAETMPVGIGLQAEGGPKPYPIDRADYLAGTMETVGASFAAATRATSLRRVCVSPASSLPPQLPLGGSTIGTTAWHSSEPPWARWTILTG